MLLLGTFEDLLTIELNLFEQSLACYSLLGWVDPVCFVPPIYTKGFTLSINRFFSASHKDGLYSEGFALKSHKKLFECYANGVGSFGMSVNPT